MAEQTQPTDADKAKPEADKAQADKGKQQAADQPKKIELTEDDLQARIDAALKSDRDKAAEKARKEKADADEAAAKEQGKWKELAEKAEARAAAAELEAKRKAARIELDAYLNSDEKFTPYRAAAALIESHVKVEADTDPADVTKAIKAAVDQYVKLLPVQAAKPGPGGGARGREDVRGRAAEAAAAKEGKRNNHETDTVAATRF